LTFDLPLTSGDKVNVRTSENKEQKCSNQCCFCSNDLNCGNVQAFSFLQIEHENNVTEVNNDTAKNEGTRERKLNNNIT